MKPILFLLLALIATTADAQMRTWTFSQDGTTQGQSGVWSFRKGGRVEAQYIRREGTNVILQLKMDGKEKSVPMVCLSEDDWKYVWALMTASEQQKSQGEAAALTANQETKARTQAVVDQKQAETRQKLLEMAAQKEKQASQLDAQAQRVGGSARKSKLDDAASLRKEAKRLIDAATSLDPSSAGQSASKKK
jgi:hypothetical protein